MKDRDNKIFLNQVIQNTMKVLEVLSQNFPEPVLAKDVGNILNLPTDIVEMILINLAYGNYIRETEVGFQQLNINVEQLKPQTLRTLDQSFADHGKKMPKFRDRFGRVYSV